MIISANSDPNKAAFNNLLNATIEELNTQVQHSPQKVSTLLGTKLEPYVKDIMSDLAVGTPFEDSIELISGQKFPDIIAQKHYGIEVKTTIQNHWRTTGNSVLESTRVQDVERIFMLFAKLAAPVEFRCRPYEEVLSEVVVTHSPRYLIDMNLKQGETIFDKIKLPYDTLRKKSNPIKPITDYYRGKLKPGEELWWMESEQHHRSTNIVIRIWNNLSKEEKQEIRIRSMVYFPELFSNKSDKFGRLAIWLVTSQAIVCPNIRDLFSAGGKQDVIFDKKVYQALPRIIVNLLNNLPTLLEVILNTSAIELSEYWGIKTTENKKVADWAHLTTQHIGKIYDTHFLNLKDILASI